MKKQVKVNVNPIYDAVEEALSEPQPEIIIEERHRKPYKARKTYTPEEAEEALEALNTTGRKGLKAPRINLAFTPSNYAFIKIMAQVRGQTMTEFINNIMEEARENHADIYEQAIRFRNSL